MSIPKPVILDISEHQLPSRPNFEVWKKGDIIYNTNPVILGEEGNQYIVDRWIAKEDGSGSNIWIESRVLTGS